jgi:4a-hydroxytetrahydrobiopterin dehydratase
MPARSRGDLVRGDSLGFGAWWLVLSGVAPAARSASSPDVFPTLITNPMAELLNNQDIKAWLKKLPEWDQDKKHIERVFEFDDFTGAIDFVNSVAEIAEEEEHHPEIDIRYNKVRIGLSTHSEGGLTELDFELAERIETLVE